VRYPSEEGRDKAVVSRKEVMALAIPSSPRQRPSAVRRGLLDYEARRIARTVCAYGALERARVYELTEASRWRAESFDRACELAVQRGLVRDLGLGFYAAPARPATTGRAASGSRSLPFVSLLAGRLGKRR
jgi:hypothetical protein